MARRHLAIFLKGAVEKILDGRKKVEIRFSQNRIVPYAEIGKGDEIYLKTAGGKIIGKVKVDNVLFYDRLTVEMIANIRREYSRVSCLGDSFWQAKAKAAYVTIIFLKDPQRFLAPVFFKKNDRRGWLVLEKDLN